MTPTNHMIQVRVLDIMALRKEQKRAAVEALGWRDRYRMPTREQITELVKHHAGWEDAQ